MAARLTTATVVAVLQRRAMFLRIAANVRFQLIKCAAHAARRRSVSLVEQVMLMRAGAMVLHSIRVG
jgi:hypothetical protein